MNRAMYFQRGAQLSLRIDLSFRIKQINAFPFCMKLDRHCLQYQQKNCKSQPSNRISLFINRIGQRLLQHHDAAKLWDCISEKSLQGLQCRPYIDCIQRLHMYSQFFFIYYYQKWKLLILEIIAETFICINLCHSKYVRVICKTANMCSQK